MTDNLINPIHQNDKNTSIMSGDYNRKRLIYPQPDENLIYDSNPTRVLLFIFGMVERVDFIESSTVILGRFDSQLKTGVQLDLSNYRAIERGVSRSHCQLELKDGQLIVTDLNSSNGTYVAGKRLVPHTPHVLKKGEELALGRLPIQIIMG